MQLISAAGLLRMRDCIHFFFLFASVLFSSWLELFVYCRTGGVVVSAVVSLRTQVSFLSLLFFIVAVAFFAVVILLKFCLK